METMWNLSLNNNELEIARGLLVTDLEWEDIPHIARTFVCPGSDARCEASPHLVQVENLPVACELAGFVGWRSKQIFPDLHYKTPVYVMDRS